MLAETVMLERAQQYDVQALAEIYDTFSPRLFRYAYRLLGDENLAEDCVAETFNRFLNAIKHGKGPQDYLQAYLYRTAHNWIIDYYRYRRSPSMPEEMDRIMDPGASLDTVVMQKNQQERVRAALYLLTPEQRQVVVLKYLEGLDNQEIAEAVNKPVGSVKSLQHRALNSLKRILEKDMVI